MPRSVSYHDCLRARHSPASGCCRIDENSFCKDCRGSTTRSTSRTRTPASKLSLTIYGTVLTESGHQSSATIRNRRSPFFSATARVASSHRRRIVRMSNPARRKPRATRTRCRPAGVAKVEGARLVRSRRPRHRHRARFRCRECRPEEDSMLSCLVRGFVDHGRQVDFVQGLE